MWRSSLSIDSSIIRTDSRRLDHVADGEPLDGLILGGASRAVGAPDGLDVAAACEITSQQIPVRVCSGEQGMRTLLVAAVVLSLLDHLDGYLSVLVLKRV